MDLNALYAKSGRLIKSLTERIHALGKGVGSQVFCKPDIEKYVTALGRYLPLRHRHILTRDNRVRLRYVLPAAFCLFALLGVSTAYTVQAAMSGVERMVTGKGQSISVAQRSSEGLDQLMDTLAASQKRLQRYVSRPPQSEEIKDNPVQMAALTAPVPDPEPQPQEKNLEIGKGDTLAKIMQDAGVKGGDAYRVVKAMEDHYDPRNIKPGQKIALRFDPDDQGGHIFTTMKMELDPLKTLKVSRRSTGGFDSDIEEKAVEKRIYAKKADIKVSLYGSAEKAGFPVPVIAEAIRIYSWDVDFQRDIRQGDTFEVMYEQLETTEGIKVKSGEVLYARLNVNGQDIPVYRFEMDNGDVDYFTTDGTSVRKALMKTPIDGARLSSGFGMRRHPVLGYTKMHKGVDFAAPTGTPIYAAGDGTIERIGRWSSYGNYIRIRHNSTLKTAYAHMNNFAKGLSVGKRVKQGQVIGYVGTTGRSTGPHLHYEVLLNGNQVSPSKVKLPQGETLTGKQLTAFKAHMKKVKQQYAGLTGKMKYASNVSLR